MACSNEYREFAEQQFNAAERAELPLVRQRHLKAAERWQQLADEMEQFERPARVAGMRQDYFY